VYQASGTKVGTWNVNQITSTTSPSGQFYSINQDRIITLDNGDKLMITGQNSSNAGCGGSMGDGYGIVVYPSSPNYYSNPKMFVMGYHGGMSGGVRYFTGWSAATEISWDSGTSFNSCTGSPPLTPFYGTFVFAVSP